ncbi:MAG TPA: Ig-like domain-containing protein, partial [Candidatus Acidoferrum sp.]
MKRNYSAIALAAILMLSISLVVGCGGSSPKVVSVSVAPTSANIAVAATQQFTATANYSNNTSKDVTSSATWASSSTTVASISTGGLATGVAGGTSNITASFNGVTSSAAVLTVTASPQLVSIAVTPATPSLAPAATQQFTAMGTYSSGPPQDLTSQVNWSSSRTVNATITAAGLATAVNPGATTISATLSGVTGSTVLTVTGTPVVVGLQVTPGTDTVSVGSTVSYTALELLSDGTTQPLTGAVTWASGTTATATIGSSNGIAIAAATGTSTITATETALTGTGSLTVQAAAARFAFNADSGGSGGVLTEWSVDAATGAFTPVATSAFISGLQQVLVHPSGHYFYAIDQLSKLVQYDVNYTSGAVTADANPGTPTSTASGQSKAAIDPTGRFIYLVNSNPGPSGVAGLYSFSIKQTTDLVSGAGALTAIGSNPITTNLTSPTDILIDKTGTYAYVVDAGPGATGSVFQYKIDPVTGALTPLAPVSVATGNSPLYGVIDPTNTYLYVANFNDASISVYKIGTGGLLAQVGSSFTV